LGDITGFSARVYSKNCNMRGTITEKYKESRAIRVTVNVLQAEDVGKRYGEFVALREVNLRVDAGECFGLIGPNGAGKSTFMRIVAGILRNFEGSVRLFGLDIRRNPRQVKRRIGYLPEEPSLYTRPRARELLEYFLRLYGEKGDVRERVMGVLDLVGLAHRAEDRVGTFSKGMRQRLAIARALVHDPDLLMLDEPTMGLDPATADRVRNFILSQREAGRTILICTHYMDEADLLCDRIGVMDGGRLVASGTNQEIKEMARSGPGRIEVILENPKLEDHQLSVFTSYRLTANGIIGEAELGVAYESLKPNGIISIRRLAPSLKDSFVLLTEAGDSNA